MKYSELLRWLMLPMVLVCLPGFGLAAEGEKGEEGSSPQCRPSALEQRRHGERPMMEHESMRSMMERMMGQMSGGREAHCRMSISPLERREELKLSPEQMEALKPIELDYRKATIKKQAEIRLAEVELSSLLDRKKPDVDALKKKAKEISDLQADLMVYRTEALLKLRDILSEEQHEKFKSLLRQGMETFRRACPMHGMGGMP